VAPWQLAQVYEATPLCPQFFVKLVNELLLVWHLSHCTASDVTGTWLEIAFVPLTAVYVPLWQVEQAVAPVCGQLVAYVLKPPVFFAPV
jgi:hypothetical protein